MVTHESGSEHPTWISVGEENDCFTNGPPRLVLTSGDNKGCIALLPDRDLLEKIQEAISDDSDVRQLESQTDAKVHRLFLKEEMLDEKISDTEADIAKYEGIPSPDALEILQKLQAKLARLHRKQEDVKEQLRASRHSLYSQYRIQRSGIHKLLGVLQEVLIESKVIEPEVEQDDATDAGSEAKFATNDDEDKDLAPAVHRETAMTGSIGSDGDSEATDRLNANPESAEQVALIRRYQMAQTRLRAMDDSFETRGERFDEEARERRRKIETGEEVESESAFALRQINDTRRMGRRLSDAEEAVEAAKAAAVAAGVQIPGSDVESGFVDDVNDGYALSSEKEVVSSINRPEVLKWLQKVPAEGTEEPAEADVDDWDAKTANMSDSWSAVAGGPDKKRISRWRSACAAFHL